MSDKINPKDAVPFQVQHIIDSMLSPKDNVFVRGNFRTRLDIIRTVIDAAIKKYDNESFFANQKGKKSS